jgi:hypothetical protein
VRAGGWDIRARLGIIAAPLRQGQLRRGATTDWRTVAA